MQQEELGLVEGERECVELQSPRRRLIRRTGGQFFYAADFKVELENGRKTEQRFSSCKISAESLIAIRLTAADFAAEMRRFLI